MLANREVLFHPKMPPDTVGVGSFELMSGAVRDACVLSRRMSDHEQARALCEAAQEARDRAPRKMRERCALPAQDAPAQD